ncbi:cation:proton antiporter [Phenylobacterium sp.]|uniref:cation:proton antiporter n=1 Tax=Phenylobacterium sp. TaxID=1871053 RepID=UPI002731EB02|nr:cation:proton antiporter [Phenylobacterium sp.]MDP1875500.1 cation:proton antiporter [Phenylobacterium sp.]
MLNEWIAASVFNEVAALLVLAAGVGSVGLLLRQPLIVSFIAVGIIAGPSVLDVARSSEAIDLLAELGIAVLLFLVGIKLDVKLVRNLGPVALATGLGQVLFTSGFGFLIGLGLGLDVTTSLYVAVALTFSSTIIIVKLLSDKRELETLHGRIALGFLIVQDIVVVLAMIVLSAVGVGAAEDASAADVLRVFAAGAAMLGLVILFARFLADRLTERLARSPELLIGFAIALAAAFAALGEGLGFGKELGGLLAGVALASTPFRDSISARLAPLRDFLLLFFFIALGSSLDLGGLGANGFGAVVLSLFVLIGNPLIVILIMAVLGYHQRTGFLAGLTVAQISEFSLIFMAMGVTIGHVTNDALALVTLVGLITIAASTYMITYSHQLYRICEPALALVGRMRRPDPRHAQAETEEAGGGYDVVLFGLGRYGGALGRGLAEAGYEVLGVDISPASVRAWRDDGYDGVFGDLSDPEFLGGLPLSGVNWVVATVRIEADGVNHADGRIVLMQHLRERGFEGQVALTSNRPEEVDLLLTAGADLVLTPFADAASHGIAAIEAFRSPGDPGESGAPRRR